MPEYLSPGVFIEELPSRLRAIEGVSTSTAAFVGPAQRGPVPGYLWPGMGAPGLPFVPAGGFVLEPDPSPLLVTSFAEFQRGFGTPLPIAAPGDTNDYGFLGHAVRAFFDNGGKRAFVARVVGATATPSTLTVLQGVAYRMMRSAATTDTGVFLNSTRGIGVGTNLSFIRQSDGTVLVASVAVSAYDVQANSVTFGAAIGVALDATDVSVVRVGSLPAGSGPVFIARTPGGWSANLSVLIAASDRQPVVVTGAVAVGGTIVPVQNVSSLYIGGSIEIDHNGAGRSRHQIADINPGRRQVTLATAIAAPALTVNATVRMLEIDVTISDDTGVAPTESYRGMAWAQGGSADVRRHYAWTINARSRLVWVKPPAAASETFDLARQPITPSGFPMRPTGANTGVDGLPTSDAHWVGSDLGPGQRSGIESLKDLTDVRIIAAPGKTTPTVQLALIAQCELLRYRFAVLDGERDPAAGSITSILTHRNLYDTSFAGYYQPWVTVQIDGQNRQLPPSGYIAGIYARVDNARGVWKAPANEPVLTASALKTYYTTGEQELLNPRGVNLIRQFDQGGIRVWGARTLSSDPDVKYVNVRRTLIFLEASIDRGMQWVVFEPNTPDTWRRVVNSITSFLTTQWREGALFGRKPEDAFFVRCDESTMTADDILNGRLICQIGVAIVRPAEFVIFRIEQITNFGAKS